MRVIQSPFVQPTRSVICSFECLHRTSPQDSIQRTKKKIGSKRNSSKHDGLNPIFARPQWFIRSIFNECYQKTSDNTINILLNNRPAVENSVICILRCIGYLYIVNTFFRSVHEIRTVYLSRVCFEDQRANTTSHINFVFLLC